MRRALSPNNANLGALTGRRHHVPRPTDEIHAFFYANQTEVALRGHVIEVIGYYEASAVVLDGKDQARSLPD
jgi:hypothetical protein